MRSNISDTGPFGDGASSRIPNSPTDTPWLCPEVLGSNMGFIMEAIKSFWKVSLTVWSMSSRNNAAIVCSRKSSGSSVSKDQTALTEKSYLSDP